VDKLEALDSAIQECDRRLALIGPSDWELPTPCDEWNVRFLVYHICYASALYAQLAAGSKFEDLELPLPEDVDHDPIAHCRHQATALTEIFRKPGTLEVVASDWPPKPGATGTQMIEYRTLDLMVHTWDLSRAIGADEMLPTPLVEEGLLCAQTEWADTLRGGGFFREPTKSPTLSDEPPLWQLLRLTGREP
jgi:uncharacterized protein (TIGR03086 family)